MNTHITRVWLNNSNNFVISECPVKHNAAVAEMVAKGGNKLDSNVCTHALGEVFVNRVIGLPRYLNSNVDAVMLQAAHTIFQAHIKLNDAGVEVKALDMACGDVLNGLLSLYDFPKDFENGFQIDEVHEILGDYYMEDTLDLDDCLCKFYQYLAKHSVIGGCEIAPSNKREDIQ